MTFTQNFLRTFNPICQVYFAGFESDTLRLQRAGWQLSMEQLYDRNMLRLAMKHEGARLHALSAPVSYQAMALLNPNYQQPVPIEFQIQYMASNMQFEIHPVRGSMSFAAVDAYPTFEEIKRVRFEDAIPFKPINHEASEIVIARESVPELMQRILELQDPKQAEIRQKLRKEAWRKGEPGNLFSEGYKPAADIMAQVITLAG